MAFCALFGVWSALETGYPTSQPRGYKGMLHSHTHCLCKSRLWSGSHQESDKQKTPWEKGRGKKQPTHRVPQGRGTLGRLGCVINKRILTLSLVFPAGS